MKVSREKELQFHYPLKDNPKSIARREIEERELQDKKYLLKVFTVGAIVIIWQGVWVPTNLLNTEKEESKVQYESFISAYENGWDDQCSAIFSRIGGIGNLAFGRGITLTYPQCLSLKLSTSATDSFKKHIGGYIRDSSAYEMSQSGRGYANDDALSKIFSMSPYWCYGVDCVSESDFGIFR